MMDKTAKSLCATGLLALLAALPAKAAVDPLVNFINNYRAPLGSPVELGVWSGDLDECKKIADENGIPMIAIWSREGCAHCNILDNALTSEVVQNWAKTSGMVLCFTCSRDPLGVRQGPESGNGKYYWFCKRPDMISSYPFVRFYWYENGKKKVDFSVHGDKLDKQQGKGGDGTYNKAGQYVVDYIMKTSGFGAYVPRTLSSYNGGLFAIEETDGHRLEADEKTAEITFEMVREGDAAAEATNNTVRVIGPDGAVKDTLSLNWTAGQTSQTVTVDVSKIGFTSNGQTASLVAVSADGEPQATNHIAYVTGNSVSNPLWIGERSAVATRGASVPVLEYGEWTMDIDVAKAKVAAEEGRAYTLVAVEGSLWCHDCANTERNFTELEDSSSNNRLATWAAANNVALVAIDIPNYDPSGDTRQSPTLLSREPFATTLAFESEQYGIYDVSKGGAPASLTNAVLRSGLGYLTRKGASDEEAAAVLKRNFDLVSTDVSEGGFHSGVDSRKWRTGVPIFVLLDKNGVPKARFTRFQNVSPLVADRDNFDSYIKRFEEMMAIADNTDGHDDGGVLENDRPGDGATAFAANGGTAAGEISHCDFTDVFKLDGVGGNALQKVSVKGPEGAKDAEIAVSFLSIDTSGQTQTIATKTGSLADGVELEYTFTSAGEYYVSVSGADIAKGELSAVATDSMNFRAYTISGNVVLVPQESRASGTAPEGSKEAVMRLEAGQMYRIEGVDSVNSADVLTPTNPEDPYCLFYTANSSGDKTVHTAYSGGTVTYQKWQPGKAGFAKETETATESAGEVAVAFSRLEGVSGDLTVRISLDEEATTLYNSEGEARFTFEPVDLVWKDGESGAKTVTIGIVDDIRYDGMGVVALKAEITAQENGDIVLTAPSYALTVTENDKQSAGKVSFTAADPFFSRKLTVYARESEGATIYASRTEASDGAVNVKVSATSGATLSGDVEDGALAWANHNSDDKQIKVSGIAAGKSSRVSLSSAAGGLKILSGASAVTVVSVSDDAPAFAKDAAEETLYRYIATSNTYPVVLAESAAGATLSFTKLSGTLPAGLRAAFDGASESLAIFGTPTCKAGTYSAVYQVKQRVSGKTTPGLTIEIVWNVNDLTTAGDGMYNASVASARSRVLKDIAVVDTESGRLAGVLQLTIGSTGKCSAKYKCQAGTVSLSSKGWLDYDSTDAGLFATLESSKSDYVLSVEVESDGSVTAQLSDPAFESVLSAETDGFAWSKEENASAWQGYYTVAMPLVSVQEDSPGLAPRGTGYLTLKMNTAAAWNKGEVSWAGMLPDGTAISGKTVLSRGDCQAALPLFAVSSKDVFSAIVNITEGAIERKASGGDCQSVLAASDVVPFWKRKADFGAGWTADYGIYGSIYDPTENLAEAYAYYYPESTGAAIAFGIEDGLGGAIAAGTPVATDPVAINISSASGSSAIKIASGTANPQRVSLSFNRTTGIVSGSFNMPIVDANGASRIVSASYKGVVLVGYGPGCGCGEEAPASGAELPFVNGSFYVSDKVKSGSKTLTVKRGGTATVE